MNIGAAVRAHPAVATCAGAAAFAVVASSLLPNLPFSDEWGHAVGHLVAGVTAGLLALSARWWEWEATGRLGWWGRAVSAGAAATFAIGQVAEAIGAFGYDGYARVNQLASVHDLAMFLGPLAMLGLLVGGVVTLAGNLTAVKPSKTTTVVLALGAVSLATAVTLMVLGKA